MTTNVLKAARRLRPLLGLVLVSVALSACTMSPQNWEHMHDGYNRNIYTGDDHI